MKKAAILATLLLFTSISWGENLIKNGGFESGLNDWLQWEARSGGITVSSDSNSETAAARLSGGLIYQAAAVSGGKEYKLTGQFKGEHTFGMVMGVEFYDSAGASIETFEDFPQNAAFYQEVSISFRSPDQAVSAFVYFWGDGAISMLVDDVVFEEVVPNETENLLKNSGFDDGLSSWDRLTSSRGKVKIVTGSSIQGKVVSLSGGLIYQTVSSESGSYQLSGRYKTKRRPAFMEVGISYFDANNQELRTDLINPSLSVEFADFRVDGTAPEETRSIIVYGRGEARGELLLDDLVLTKNEPSSGVELTNQIMTFSQTFDDNGQTVSADRTVEVRMPSTGDGRLPVMIMFHGDGGRLTDMFDIFSFLGNEYIQVSCGAYNGEWNTGNTGSPAPDVELVESLISELRTYSNVDPDQITLAGWSGGAALVNRLLIESSEDLFQQGIMIGVQLKRSQYLNGSFWSDPNDTGEFTTEAFPATGRKILQIHGDADPVAPYAGVPGLTGFHNSTDSIFFWAQAMGYTGEKIEDFNASGFAWGLKFEYLDGQVSHFRVFDGDHLGYINDFDRTPMQSAVNEFLGRF